MKKLSMVMATVLLFVSCFCFYADAAITKVDFAVNAPDEVNVGKDVTISVDFSGNTGFSTLGVKLTYPEGFTYVADSAKGSTETDEWFFLEFGGEQGLTYAIYHEEEARTLTFVGATMDNVTADAGTLFTATFTAPDTVGENFAFTVEQFDVAYNDVGDTVTVTKTDDSLNVTELTYILGDVDGNGAVQTGDAMIAFYIATKKITDPSVINATAADAADVIIDGKITTADAMRIFYHATKKITSFE